MGIHEISEFVKNLGVKQPHSVHAEKNIKDQSLVIDGNNILFEFLRVLQTTRESFYGGDYDYLSERLGDFCDGLKKLNIKPIFVFDGAGRESTLEHRKEKSCNTISVVKDLMKEVPAWKDHPFRQCLDKKTMLETLRSLEVPLCVVDGEADKMIASLAHHLGCPVVSDDSDFFLYDLPAGVICCTDMVSPLDSMSSLRKVYSRKRLAGSFNIVDEENLLILSYICGVRSQSKSQIGKFIQKHIEPSGNGGQMEQVMLWIARHATLDETIKAIVTKDHLADHHDIKRGCEAYQYDPKDFIDYFLKGESFDGYTESLPGKFWSICRKGLFSNTLLSVLSCQNRLFYPLVEDTNEESTWRCSESIRALLYEILAASVPTPIDTVTEYDREKKKVVPFRVKIPTSDRAKYALRAIFELPKLDRLQIFHNRLVGVSSSFGRTLDETLLASIIIFWMNKGNPQPSEKHLVSLLACIADMGWVKKSFVKPTGKMNVQCVHQYSQFQTVLHDSLDLLGLLGIKHTLRIPSTVKGSCFHLFYQHAQKYGGWRVIIAKMPEDTRPRFYRFYSYLIKNRQPLADNSDDAQQTVSMKTKGNHQGGAKIKAGNIAQTQNRFTLLNDSDSSSSSSSS